MDKDGPGKRIDPSSIQDAIPVKEGKSRLGNHSPYKVAGRTYYVMNSADGYRARGVASWYGKKFHGNTTSSGEIFDMYLPTAAHRHLPLPTYVLIRNLDNGKQAILKVNDRGPFVDDRLIDVSYGAAVKLGMAKQGTANVEITALNDDNIHLVGGWQEKLEPLPNFDTAEIQNTAQNLGTGRGLQNTSIMASEMKPGRPFYGDSETPVSNEQYRQAQQMGQGMNQPVSPASNYPQMNTVNQQPAAYEKPLYEQPALTEKNSTQNYSSPNIAVQNPVGALPTQMRNTPPQPISEAELGAFNGVGDATSRGLQELASYGYDENQQVQQQAMPAQPMMNSQPTSQAYNPQGAYQAPQSNQRPRSPSRVQSQTNQVVVQAGAFSDFANARRLHQGLRPVGYRTYIEKINGGNGDVFRVRIGPLDPQQAEQASSRLMQMGMSNYRFMQDRSDGQCIEGC